MRFILGIDPGPTASAFVLFDGVRPLDHAHVENAHLLDFLTRRRFTSSEYLVVIEQLESFGAMTAIAAREVIGTAFWSGRFAQVAGEYELLPRKKIKRHLCGNIKAGNPQVRLALMQRFGGGFPVTFTDHKFAALAVAVTWWDLHENKEFEVLRAATVRD
jgi:hypothetical protein